MAGRKRIVSSVAPLELESIYISASEVAELVGVDSATVYRWAGTYVDMPVLRIGGVVRFHRQKLLTWLEAREQGPRAQRQAQGGRTSSK